MHIAAYTWQLLSLERRDHDVEDEAYLKRDRCFMKIDYYICKISRHVDIYKVRGVVFKV